MAGFIRRYGYFPSQQTISQIEGVVIVDLPPPATIQGIQTGVAGIVGEFPDVTYAVSVDGSGNVTTKPQPVEVTSSQDMIDKVGGFDPTIGDFGGADGNGFTAVSGKRFSRLVLVPVNLASSKGVRLWRKLPLCTSATNPSPIVPMQAARVPAGTEFKAGANRVNLAKAVDFTAELDIARGIDGVQVAGGPTTPITFTSASATFITSGVQEGDALVIGTFSSPGVPDTYRVVAVPSETTLDVEALDGSLQTWTGSANLPYRVHPAAAFDTGANHQLSEVQGYLIPARPLDSTVAEGSYINPTVQAPAQTATSWNPLTGLQMATQPGVGNALIYTAAVQAPNVTGTGLNTLYQTAIDSLLGDSSPARDVSILVAARTTSGIRSYLKQHVQLASANGIGRMTIIGPELTVVNETTVLGSSDPGVGANRDERVIYCWPGVRVNVSEAFGFNILTANGTYTSDGNLDVRADAFMASILSNLAAEKNPGQATDPVPLCLAPILAFQRGNLPAFSMTDYILFRQNGVAAIRFDRTAGKVFQSGITTSLLPGQKNINRRRMADEIEDSLAQAYNPLSKQVLTNQLRDAIDAETVAYLEGLKSATNPAAQRIADYSVDSRSGNTPALYAAGIHVVIVRVKMLATADVIVLQAEVGPSVNITAA